MNEIREWNFEGTGVRTIELDGDPWWVLTDVCGVLELTSPHKVAARLDDDERNQIPVTDSLGRMQQTTIINESGLYAVILRSDKPQAKAFRKWVTGEVLPAIRKTGQYKQPDPEPETKPDSYMIDDRVQRAQRWIEEYREHAEEVNRLQLTVDAQEEELRVRRVKEETMRAILGDEPILVEEMAKIMQAAGLDTNKYKLFEWMRGHDWLGNGKNGADWNIPTSSSNADERFIVKETQLHVNGGLVTRYTPKLTPRGQEILLELMMCERCGALEPQDWHTGKPIKEITFKRK